MNSNFEIIIYLKTKKHLLYIIFLTSLHVEAMANVHSACVNTSTTTTATPYHVGDVILDGDEASQVVVFEHGAPTNWALQVYKWRLHFNIPDEDPEGHRDNALEILTSPPPLDSESSCKKRKLQDAGLEMN